jgi:hypothetical protein
MAALILLAAAEPEAAAQVAAPPRPFASPPPVSVQDVYLTPQPAGLEEISAGVHARRAVRTRGTLAYLETGNPGYFQLREDAARVVVIPMPEVAGSLLRLIGRRVEVVGYVRELERNQGTCRFRGNMAAPRSLCDDPELPPKPDLDRPGRLGWPPWSITVWAGSDFTRPGRRPGEPERLADLLDAADRTMVTAVGRFCGANLCGDVTGPAPSREAWVLHDGDTSLWVVGRRAEGNGFRLDPTYRGDTTHWLAVKGRLATCGAARCLRAQSVVLATPPEWDE